MNLPEARRLARHVARDLPSTRLDRQWVAIEARLRQQGVRDGRSVRLRRWWAPAAVAVVVAGALLVVRARRGVAPGALAGAVLEGGPGDSLTLPDGARVSLAERTRVEVASVGVDGEELVLRHGGVDLAVPHRQGRKLVLHAGAYDVVDVGTRFHVDLRDSGGCTVSVAEGTVEIRRRDGGAEARRVGAGETWSSAPAASKPAAAPSVEPAPPAPAEETTQVPFEPASAHPAASPAEAPPSAAALLDTATRARSAGRSREAALAFDALRKRYRNDSRAALAAFELGRLRLDSLGDAPGAVEALSDAMALARPTDPLREDAEARRVEALESLDPAGCRQARDAYLARYPTGIHATMVARRCQGR